MRYLVAVDGFEASERALSFARDQARDTRAAIDVVHVVDEGGGDPETREQIRETVDAVMRDADVEYELHFPTTTKRTQPATKAGKRVLEFADEHDSDVVYVGNEETGTAERRGRV